MKGICCFNLINIMQDTMSKGFKWNMFITSFIPLWVSIIVSNIWSIIENSSELWSFEKSMMSNLFLVIKEEIISIIVIMVVFILMMTSIVAINIFLKDKKSNKEPPEITIKKATRANKLTSEFLLAYRNLLED